MESKSKNILLVTRGKLNCFSLVQQLKDLLGDKAEVSGYNVDEPLSPIIFEADLVVFSTKSITTFIPQNILKSIKAKTIVARRTINFNEIYKLYKLSPRTKAMLVNDRKETAEEVISLLYGMGFDHLWLIPVYPEHPNPPKVDIAITPGEPHLVPKGVKSIIDIGIRKLDISTLVEILINLNLLDDKANILSARYMSDIVEISRKLSESLVSNERSNKLLESVIQKVNNGVVATDQDGKVVIYNSSAERIFNINKERAMGINSDELFPSLKINKVLETGIAEENIHEFFNNKNLLINRIPLEYGGKINGALLTCYEFGEVEKIENKLRNILYSKGHIAKYCFTDIKGQSEPLLKQILNAKKFAILDTTVLVQGESGTGKELMAHSIHNESPRAGRPFVAINCAALPRDLLESELFGFEEGTFTGAKKGGKMGLFEQAHLGTIFLDEIGEIPPQVQVKLLRVLEAKEVMRIGSDRIIPIDVRIIAATNQDLRKLVEQKTFREDLFFRLNILKIYMPPLRERKEDIFLLANLMLLEKGKTLDEFFSEELKQWILSYNWPGNIRELKNIIEFLVATVHGYKAAKGDLPVDLQQNYVNRSDVKLVMPLGSRKSLTPTPLTVNGFNLLSEDIIILDILQKYGECGLNLGRRKIRELIESTGNLVSEDKIRSRLKILEKNKLIDISVGRKGSTITENGREILREVRNQVITLISPSVLEF